MEHYKEKLKIQNVVMGICCLVLTVFAVLTIGSELGWFSILKPVAGDDHRHSTWYGYCTGASCSLTAVMVFGLIRNIGAMKDEKKLKKLYVKEHDERNIQIQILARNTAMQIMLLAGLAATVISGYFSMTISVTILACTFFSSGISLFLVGYYSKKL